MDAKPIPLMTALKNFREAKGWTQGQMAAQLGMIRTTYHRMEKGKCPVRKTHILALERLGFNGHVTITAEEAKKICDRLEYDSSWDKCGSGYYALKNATKLMFDLS